MFSESPAVEIDREKEINLKIEGLETLSGGRHERVRAVEGEEKGECQ